MVGRPPKSLNTLFQAHNNILSAGSLLLLLLMVEEIFPIYWKNGLFYAMCNEKSWTDRMGFYYLINYMFKYIELLDTIFLAFKKKPLRDFCLFFHGSVLVLNASFRIPPRLPSLCDCIPVFRGITGQDKHIMGCHHFKLGCACLNVLLLLRHRWWG
jgi:hypothetical protein